MHAATLHKSSSLALVSAHCWTVILLFLSSRCGCFDLQHKYESFCRYLLPQKMISNYKGIIQQRDKYLPGV